MNQCLQHVSEVSPVFWVKPSYSATTVFQRMVLRFPKPLIYCLLISTMKWIWLAKTLSSSLHSRDLPWIWLTSVCPENWLVK